MEKNKYSNGAEWQLYKYWLLHKRPTQGLHVYNSK